jgi:hypothetical protein
VKKGLPRRHCRDYRLHPTAGDQFGHLGDEAPGDLDRFGRKLGRYLRAGASLIIGNGLEVVDEAKEGAQLIIGARVSPDESVKFRFYSA